MTDKRDPFQTLREDPFEPRRTVEMFVRFTDGTGHTLHAVENTPANRRTVDRMAAHLLAKQDITSIQVDVRTGRTAGYERSR